MALPSGERYNASAVHVVAFFVSSKFPSQAWPDGSFDFRVQGTASPALAGSVAFLVDSSGSMDFNADPSCSLSCESRRKLVQRVVSNIAQRAQGAVELAVW